MSHAGTKMHLPLAVKTMKLRLCHTFVRLHRLAFVPRSKRC